MTARLLPALVAAGVVAFLLVAAVAPRLLAPGDPLAIDPASAFAAPSAAHPLGADESGRDIYTRIVHGAGQSLSIGVAATGIGLALALLLGVPAGLTAGRRGRHVHPSWVDAAIGRVLEVLFALPGLLLALVFIAFAGPGVVTTVIAVGLSTAPGYARIVRTQVLRLREAEMVQAARVLGRSRWRILTRHVLPNALGPVAVLATLGVGQAVVWASALSFLGLGAPPPAPEWGAMLSAGRTYLSVAWWMTVFPGLAIVAVAAATTVLGRYFQRRAEGLA
ncbi:ABC transporter permease [Zhihengliuella flava]|uniref:Peptide/nickel transport system permease protein n=1 Tax=Zhihengliuella flava TaxID=1285193 RepID=A0A931D434_9MICC|nr:ABC transporter permease [Zhihengliuella flava]MBG6084044.1 peptide/nickel transport system permease protein [Zhihengliuella flava]